MRNAVLGLLFSLFAAGCAAADARDGNWWLAKAERDKIQFMVGFFDGASFQADEADMALSPMGYVFAAAGRDSCGTVCQDSRRAQFLEDAASVRKTRARLDDVTAGQLVDGCNKLYEDYRNRLIPVYELMGVVLWGIKGGTQAQIDGRLEHLRKPK